MIVATYLGPHARVKVVQCADKQLQGNHTGGSRTMVGAGSVCHLAAQKLIEQGGARRSRAETRASQIADAHGNSVRLNPDGIARRARRARPLSHR
jgi:hypothetical protein